LLVLSELDVQTTDYARKEQTGTLLPQVSLIGSADNSFSSAVNSSKIDDRRLLVNVDIPLYEGGSRYARIRAAKHRNRQARFNVLDARRGITEEVTRLWRQLGASGVIIESITHAVSSSQESLDSVITEQQHGTRTVLDVLDAQRELFDARTALVNARRDEVIRSYRLLAAMGLLSAETLALVDDPYDPAAHFRKVEWQVIGF
ncbi:MAG: TolC family protein, partial [Alphaproteobacteria bacterium]